MSTSFRSLASLLAPQVSMIGYVFRVPNGVPTYSNPFLICHHSINSDFNFDVKADTLALPWVIAGLQQEGVLSEQEVKSI